MTFADAVADAVLQAIGNFAEFCALAFDYVHSVPSYLVLGNTGVVEGVNDDGAFWTKTACTQVGVRPLTHMQLA